ncbi:MAG TPA: hypothetical protein VHT25_02855 [Solirubrobacteraceae bacterium]|jgi:hypothetical protein|nr:hypothetical protein [Solirubrobacteraceae bacterium]
MRIYVHTEEKLDPDLVEALAESALGAAVELQDGEHVLLEDSEEPLDSSASLEGLGVQDRAHVFRGRRHRLLVTVEFNNESYSREFGAAARVERVFRWAVGKHAFDLDPQDAAEHTLALPDESIPPEDVHIGSLSEPEEGRLRFLLVPKHRFEG